MALPDQRTVCILSCRLSNAADKIPARPPLRPAAAARPEGAPPSYEQAMQLQPAVSGQQRGNGGALGRSAEEILAIQVGSLKFVSQALICHPAEAGRVLPALWRLWQYATVLCNVAYQVLLCSHDYAL